MRSEHVDPLVLDKIAALIEVEMVFDPRSAQIFGDLLHRWLIQPRPIACGQAASKAGLALPPCPVWLVLDQPRMQGDRYCILFDPKRRLFAAGIRIGERASRIWGWGRLFETLRHLVLGR